MLYLQTARLLLLSQYIISELLEIIWTPIFWGAYNV